MVLTNLQSDNDAWEWRITRLQDHLIMLLYNMSFAGKDTAGKTDRKSVTEPHDIQSQNR